MNDDKAGLALENDLLLGLAMDEKEKYNVLEKTRTIEAATRLARKLIYLRQYDNANKIINLTIESIK